ncbi:MAG TPA: CYTH domain-containing protein, partial [Bryobacteraceae bacterium]|nr:CYTH domain-containing protein [Bryobacteraceae bacterium]
MLRAAGFRVVKRRIFESNTLFDTKRGTLRRTGRLLRVRQAGTQHVLTYKGPEIAGKFKDREEREVTVADSHELTEIL